MRMALFLPQSSCDALLEEEKLMFRPKSFLAPGLALALALTLGVGSASADTFPLTNANPAISPFPSPYGSVDVTLTSSTTATITFTGGSFADPNNPGETCYYLFTGTGAVAVNLNNATIDSGSISGTNTLTSLFPGAGFNSTVGPLSSGGPRQEDGFGQFNTSVNSFDGFKSASTSITFDVTANTGTTFTSASDVLQNNSTGHSLAAHVGVFCPAENLTGFLATGFVGNGGNPVPEPSTMAIAGLGALGFIGYGLRRRRTK
jgi:hypothetical protein